jgi:hypothetical protein
MKTFAQHIREAKEYILWGRPKGSTDALDDVVLYTQGKSIADLDKIIKLAKEKGWHSFSKQVIDISQPYDKNAFVKAIGKKKR